MLKNYFKLAIKVLGRRKFFTFISLFGISFTLMILMLITAFLDNELGSSRPLTEKDKMLILPRLIMKKINNDTIPQVDSTMVDGIMRYDTTYTYEDRQSSYSASSLSFPFLDKNLRNMDGTSVETFFSTGNSFDVFINNNKLSLDVVYTDAVYWQVFDFKVLEGRIYRETAVKNQEQVIVITDKTARDYFGISTGITGKSITLDGKNYEVIGVLEAPKRNFESIVADVFIPYTNMESRLLASEDWFGSFTAIFLANSPNNKDRVKDAIVHKAGQISLPNPEDYNVLTLLPATFSEHYAKRVDWGFHREDPSKSYQVVFSLLFGLLMLFILLPTLNLVNVNISRILERSSEIGVRKAFGAHSGNILFQFVFENVILTFIGGFIGFVLALILINIINDSNVLGEIVLQFNGTVFLYSFLIVLVFGILSGIIPAWRMSKLQIANALKQNQL